MSKLAPSIAGIACVGIDCADPPALAQWWQQLLGGRLETYDDGDARLYPPDGRVIDFYQVPDGKTVKNRLHFDLASTDYRKAVKEAIALGATTADDVYDGTSWQVLRDPEGNEFCILKPSSH
ncbi:MAG: VOC family protein [Mycobacteriales bacterium]